MAKPTTAIGHDLPVPCLCGSLLAWTEGPDGHPDGLIHTLPTCADFDRLDPDELLAACRKKAGIRAAWDEDA